MIIKSIFAASAVALTATASLARPVDPGFSQGTSITLGDATAIRACAEEVGGDYTAVCFNRVNTLTVGPFTRDTERVVRVACDRRFPRTDKTTRGRVASEFCPQVNAGTLAPAPFLL